MQEVERRLLERFRLDLLRTTTLLRVGTIPELEPDRRPAFAGLFRRRNDAESINRALEDTLWLGRAHSLGHRRQLLNLLGYALMVNSLAVARAQRRQPLAA